MVERIWVEVNARVNYHIKDVLVNMLESGNFSLDVDLDKFSIFSLLFSSRVHAGQVLIGEETSSIFSYQYLTRMHP